MVRVVFLKVRGLPSVGFESDFLGLVGASNSWFGCQMRAALKRFWLLSTTDAANCQRQGNNGRDLPDDREHSDRPAWKQTYLAQYNTTSQSVSQDCGKYYASQLLENLFKVTTM